MPAPVDSLTPEGLRVFRRLAELPAMRRFILVGGTALALRIGHRKSEDLDFLFLGPRLPKAAVRGVVSALEKKWAVRPFEHLAQREEFEIAGLELDDYQQDYVLAERMKVSFFVLTEATVSQSVTTAKIKGFSTGFIRVASLESLFLMKVAVLAHRVMTRDLFDLYVLLRDHGFSGRDLWLRAEQARLSIDTIAYRVRHAKLRSDDPGLVGLVEDPPSFDRLKAYFIAVFDQVEQALAEESAQDASR